MFPSLFSIFTVVLVALGNLLNWFLVFHGMGRVKMSLFAKATICVPSMNFFGSALHFKDLFVFFKDALVIGIFKKYALPLKVWHCT